MGDFKMDRTIVSKSSFKEANDHVTFFKDKSPVDRLNYACDIINSIFNSDPLQKVDRTIISTRKHANKSV
jgi:hypothetical protein